MPLVLEGNVFALVDDGGIAVDEYLEIEHLIAEHGADHRGDVGCVVVIPAGTKLPSEPQRLAIAGMLKRAEPHLNGLVWVVEACGFEGAAVRGVLLGLSLFARRPYPTYVSTEIHDALGWLATRRSAAPIDVQAVARSIARTRAEYAARR